MPIDNGNDDVDNNNHNNNNPVDKPPPAKKRKKERKRLMTSYTEFTNIIDKLGKSYDPVVIKCIRYENKKGLSCDTCKRVNPKLNKLNGYWTTKPIANFNFSKIKSHLHTPKHKTRMSDEEKAKHPDTRTDVDIKRVETLANLPSKLDRIIKAIELIHTVIKEGCPLSKVKPFNELMGDTCIEPELASSYATDEIINAMQGLP